MDTSHLGKHCRTCGVICAQLSPSQIEHHKYFCRACSRAYRNEREARLKSAGQQTRSPDSLQRRTELRRQRAASDPSIAQRLAARVAVSTAIRTGRLLKQPCEKCGASRAEAHHDDYSKPLDVRWLCQTHHREYHTQIGRAA